MPELALPDSNQDLAAFQYLVCAFGDLHIRSGNSALADGQYGLANLALLQWAGNRDSVQIGSFARCAGQLAPSHAACFSRRSRGAFGKFDQRGVRQRFPGPLVLFRYGCLRSESGHGDQRWVAAGLELRFGSDGNPVRNRWTFGALR
jgi:hypothetical protein